MTALPEGHYAEIGDGLRMHYHRIGEGEPILFLHGSGPGGSGWSNFRANAEYLAKHGYCCILADSMGYGLSDKPTDRDYTLEFMSGAAVALMESRGFGSYVVLGNSQGGAQAIRIALEHPERVAKLVLMAPGGLEEREVYMGMKGIRSMLRCIYGPEGITLDGMQRVFARQVFDASIVAPEVVERRFAISQTQPIHVFKTMKVDNQTDRLPEIACPTLGLWGRNDLFCPPSGVPTLADGVPNCRVVVFGRCGHWVMVEHAEVFNRTVLDFLQHG